MFKQGGIERAPGDPLLIIGDVDPTLHREVIPVGCLPLIGFHLHHAPGNIHPGYGSRKRKVKPEMNAILGRKRQLIHHIGDFQPW